MHMVRKSGVPLDTVYTRGTIRAHARLVCAVYERTLILVLFASSDQTRHNRKRKIVLGAVVVAVGCTVVGLAMMLEWSSRGKRGTTPLLKGIAIARSLSHTLSRSRARAPSLWAVRCAEMSCA
jgi:hypothetical protein